MHLFTLFLCVWEAAASSVQAGGGMWESVCGGGGVAGPLPAFLPPFLLKTCLRIFGW